MRVAAFFRAVNVGKANRVPMKDLVARLAEAGLRDVASFRLSGNLIATADGPEQMQGLTEEVLAREFKVTTPVVVRTEDELRELEGKWPFPEKADGVQDYIYLFRPSEGARPAEAVASDDESLTIGALTPQDAYVRVPLVDGGSLYADKLIRVPKKEILTVRTWAVVRDVIRRL